MNERIPCCKLLLSSAGEDRLHQDHPASPLMRRWPSSLTVCSNNLPFQPDLILEQTARTAKNQWHPCPQSVRPAGALPVQGKHGKAERFPDAFATVCRKGPKGLWSLGLLGWDVHGKSGTTYVKVSEPGAEHSSRDPPRPL